MEERTKPLNKINLKQKQVLGDFMMRHPKLARNILSFCGEGGKALADKLWDELTMKLNAEGPPIREARLWRKAYTDFKHTVKKKITVREDAECYIKRKKIYLTKTEQQIIEAAGLDTTDLESLPPLSIRSLQQQPVADYRTIDQHCTHQMARQMDNIPITIGSMDRNDTEATDARPVAEYRTIEKHCTHQMARQVDIIPITIDSMDRNDKEPTGTVTSAIPTYCVELLQQHQQQMDSDVDDYVEDDGDTHESTMSPIYESETTPAHESEPTPDYEEASSTLSSNEQYMLNLLNSTIQTFGESQEVLYNRLDKLITGWITDQRSVQITEEQHAANMTAKRLELEIKTLELEMLKARSTVNV